MEMDISLNYKDININGTLLKVILSKHLYELYKKYEVYNKDDDLSIQIIGETYV